MMEDAYFEVVSSERVSRKLHGQSERRIKSCSLLRLVTALLLLTSLMCEVSGEKRNKWHSPFARSRRHHNSKMKTKNQNDSFLSPAFAFENSNPKDASRTKAYFSDSKHYPLNKEQRSKSPRHDFLKYHDSNSPHEMKFSEINHHQHEAKSQLQSTTLGVSNEGNPEEPKSNRGREPGHNGKSGKENEESENSGRLSSSENKHKTDDKVKVHRRFGIITGLPHKPRPNQMPPPKEVESETDSYSDHPTATNSKEELGLHQPVDEKSSMARSSKNTRTNSSYTAQDCAECYEEVRRSRCARSVEENYANDGINLIYKLRDFLVDNFPAAKVKRHSNERESDDLSPRDDEERQPASDDGWDSNTLNDIKDFILKHFREKKETSKISKECLQKRSCVECFRNVRGRASETTTENDSGNPASVSGTKSPQESGTVPYTQRTVLDQNENSSQSGTHNTRVVIEGPQSKGAGKENVATEIVLPTPLPVFDRSYKRSDTVNRQLEEDAVDESDEDSEEEEMDVRRAVTRGHQVKNAQKGDMDQGTIFHTTPHPVFGRSYERLDTENRELSEDLLDDENNVEDEKEVRRTVTRGHQGKNAERRNIDQGMHPVFGQSYVKRRLDMGNREFGKYALDEGGENSAEGEEDSFVVERAASNTDVTDDNDVTSSVAYDGDEESGIILRDSDAEHTSALPLQNSANTSDSVDLRDTSNLTNEEPDSISEESNTYSHDDSVALSTETNKGEEGTTQLPKTRRSPERNSNKRNPVKYRKSGYWSYQDIPRDYEDDPEQDSNFQKDVGEVTPESGEDTSVGGDANDGDYQYKPNDGVRGMKRVSGKNRYGDGRREENGEEYPYAAEEIPISGLVEEEPGGKYSENRAEEKIKDDYGNTYETEAASTLSIIKESFRDMFPEERRSFKEDGWFTEEAESATDVFPEAAQSPKDRLQEDSLQEAEYFDRSRGNFNAHPSPKGDGSSPKSVVGGESEYGDINGKSREDSVFRSNQENGDGTEENDSKYFVRDFRQHLPLNKLRIKQGIYKEPGYQVSVNSGESDPPHKRTSGGYLSSHHRSPLKGRHKFSRVVG